MKQLVDKVLPYLPRYLGELGALLVGPKRFMARKDLAAHETFVEAVVFAAVSIVLTVAATSPLFPEKDMWSRMGAWSVGFAVNGALLSLALRAAWRVVGGRAPLRHFFVTYAYFYGALAILFAASVLLFAGMFRTFEPEGYAWFVRQIGSPVSLEVFSNSAAAPELTRAAGVRLVWISTVFWLCQLGLVAWTVLAWGAFRRLNGSSKRRSAVAMAISAVLAVPCLMAGFFITSAMY